MGILTDTSRLGVIKVISSMNIDMDNEGFYYFNDVLYAVLRRKYTPKLEKRKGIVLKIIRKEEQDTKKLLKKMRESYILSKKPKDQQNFFLNVLIIKSIFKSWKNYSKDAVRLKSITPQFSDVEYPGENSLIQDP